MANQITIDSDPSSEDAAAAIAAITRFLSDTTPPVGVAEPVMSGWMRAALHDSVGSHDQDSIW